MISCSTSSKISMKNALKLREIERETKHLFTTVGFQVTLSFSMYASLPHKFRKTLKKRKWRENVCNSVLTEILGYFNNYTPRRHSSLQQTSLVSFHCLFLLISPCKGIHSSLGFWISHCGFRIPKRAGFHLFIYFISFFCISFSCSIRAILKNDVTKHKFVFFFDLQITGLNVLHFFITVYDIII